MNKFTFKITLFIGCLLNVFTIQSQPPTVGLTWSSGNATEGYTLFTPERSNDVFLIDNCGEKVNTWTFSETPGVTCYLLENGTLLRAGRDSLEIRDWNNNLLWAYAMNLNGLKQHHDIEPLPNGNILCLITDLYSDTDMIAEGRDPSLLNGNFKLDKIVELQPVGNNQASIIWEWKFFDHFIQDFDNTKPNYGVVQNQPELIDLNYDNNETLDWVHCNALDYNASLDQIIISSRHLNEIYIIDHSTNTIEASGHTGGNSGMGGDILWRWGNPQVYRQGGSLDQKLFGQHDSKWIESGYLDEGKISVFNNGGDGSATFSSVHLISPSIVSGIYTKINNQFSPADFEWSWDGTLLGTTVFEGRKSGTHSLPNGNFIICESAYGRISEITKTGNHLWTYINPVAITVLNQFDIPALNEIFRAEKYPSNYIGFTGKDLSPQGLIENLNSESDACIVSIVENNDEKVSIVNPIRNNTIKFSSFVNLKSFTITDINGKLVYQYSNFAGNSLQIDLTPSMYFIQLYYIDKLEVHKIVVN